MLGAGIYTPRSEVSLGQDLRVYARHCFVWYPHAWTRLWHLGRGGTDEDCVSTVRDAEVRNDREQLERG